MLALRGDFTAAEMRARLEGIFGEWQHTQPAAPAFGHVAHNPVPGIYIGERKGAAQTFFSVGHAGGRWSDPDIAVLHVAAEILGGDFTSRLPARVRKEARAAYPVNAQWAAAHVDTGTFTVEGRIKGASLMQTLRAIRDEIGRMQVEEVSESELDSARSRVLNRFAFSFDTKAKSLQRRLVFEYFGYPAGFLELYPRSVTAVSRADVLAAMKRRFRPDQLVVAIAGDPNDFERSVGTLGLPVTSLDLTIAELVPAPSPASGASLQRGKELLHMARNAVGGLEKLEFINDFTEVSTLQVDPAFGGGSSKRIQRWVAPDYLRQDNESPFGRVWLFWNGKSGWMANPRGAGPLPAAARKQAQGELFRTFFRLLLSDRIPERVVNSLGAGTVEISDPAGNIVRLVIDEQTGLPREVSYTSFPPEGPPVLIRETFTSFADVEGLKIPSRRRIDQDGRRFAEVMAQEHSFNTGLKPVELGRWR
jgi:hypothetical protein